MHSEGEVSADLVVDVPNSGLDSPLAADSPQLSNDGPNRRFDAFLSYRRAGAASLAFWLRRRLKRYTLPPDVIKVLGERSGNLPLRRLDVFLDSAFERASEDFWQCKIVPNLAASRYLIVISTPQAFVDRSDGQPNWLMREIETFLSLAGPDRIIVVLGPKAP